MIVHHFVLIIASTIFLALGEGYADDIDSNGAQRKSLILILSQLTLLFA